MTITDRAAGALQGAADAALGVQHQARAWSVEQHPYDREAAARERWHAGLPARCAFERDAFAAFEAGAAGLDRPEAAAAARQWPPYREADPEAGA